MVMIYRPMHSAAESMRRNDRYRFGVWSMMPSRRARETASVWPTPLVRKQRCKLRGSDSNSSRRSPVSTPSSIRNHDDLDSLVAQAVEGAGAKLVPVGPPNRYEEIAGHPAVTLMACKPCVDARGLTAAVLDKRIKLAGMNEFHAAAKQSDARVINF